MRYSTALVLSTFAVGQAAAHAHNARHASFHARRHAEAKRDVDYNNPELYKNVDWSKVFGDVAQQTPTPEVAVEQVAKQQAEVTPEPTPSPKKEEYTAPAPSSTKEAKPKETEESKNPLKQVGDFLEGLADGIEAFCSEKKIAGPGKNDKSPNGGIWLGHSDWSANFHNAGSEKVWLACWQDKGFSGMTLNVNLPDILIKIDVGGNQTVSFAPGASSACAPLYSNTVLGNFGGVKNTWFEATFGDYGAFDISRNVDMNGNSIEAVGSKCTSNMDTCVFKCKNPNASDCMTGYELFNCDSGNGGGGGYDPIMQGTGGGCAMGASSEKIQVTLSN
jgi:hypothetical protein